MHFASRTLFGLALLGPQLHAQDLAAALQSARVTLHAGVPHGLGPDYSARFGADGVTFTPALGDHGERPAPLRFRLTEVRRGDAVSFTRARDIAPTVHGERVQYAHDHDLVETYDVRPDGVEQSFVLARRPDGVGDLVVRGEITTDLPLVAARDDGVRFELAGGGGVAFGAVTGIDANQAHCRGSLRCDGRSLELSLPASFVDSATYPLTVDPLIGSTFLIANIAGGSDVQPSVSFDDTTQRYLVVWSVPMSASSAEIRAQFVTAAGFVGPQQLLTSAATPGIRPAVANVDALDQFAVAWVGAGFTFLVSVDAATGSVSPSALGGGPATGIALGGDIRVGASTNQVVMAVTANGSVAGTQSAFVRMVTLGFGPPSLAGVLTVYSNQDAEFAPPAISRNGGTNGVWLAAFAFRSTTTPTASVTCVPILPLGLSGALCPPATWNWTPPPGAFPQHASVANRTPNNFLVAYQTGSTTIAMRTAHVPVCGVLTLGAVFNPLAGGGADEYPEVDYTGSRYVLAWRHTTASTPHAKVMAFTTTGQGSETLAEGLTFAAQYDPTVCSRFSSGDLTSDEALVVWANAGIKGRRWQAMGTGTVTNLGGACGTSGLNDFATYSGTPVIGTTFEIELLAPTAPVLALIVGFSQAPFACGPCTIVPSSDILLAGGGPVAVPVPFDANLIGVNLYTQWLQWRQAGCAILPDFGFSNALRFTVAE